MTAGMDGSDRPCLRTVHSILAAAGREFRQSDYRGVIERLAPLEGNPALPPAARARLCLLRGRARLAAGAYDPALADLTAAKRYYQRYGRSRDRLMVDQFLAQLFFERGEHRRALRLITRAIRLAKRSGDRLEAIAAECLRAGFYQALNRPEEVRKALQGAQSSAQRVRNPVLTAVIIANLATLAQQAGGYEEAMRLYHRAAVIFRRRRQMFNLGKVLGNLGAIDFALNRFAAAGECWEEADRIYSRTGADPERCRILQNLGLAYYQQQRYRDSLRDFREALRLARRCGQPAESALVRLNMMLPLTRLKRYREGLAIHRDLDRQFRLWGMTEHRLRLKINAGFIAAESGDYRLGARYFGEGKRLLGKKAGAELEYQFHLGYAELMAKAGQQKRAIAGFEKAVRALDRIRGGLTVESFRMGYHQDKQVAYKELVRLYAETGDAEKALRYSELAKARVMSEAVACRREGDRLPLPRGAARRLARARSRIVRFRRLPARGRILNSDRLLRAEASYRRLLEQEELRSGRPLTVIRSGRFLPPVHDYLRRNPGSAVITFHLTGDRLVAVLLAGGITRLVTVPDRERIERTVGKFLGEMQLCAERSGAARDLAAARVAADALAGDLYRMLLKPLERDLVDRRELIISPNGFLHRIPFAALRDGNRYLIERCRVSIIPNLTLFPQLQADRVAADRVLALTETGSNLKNLGREINGIRSGFGQGRVEQVSAGTLPVERALLLIGQNRIVHFSGHAVTRPDDPRLSFLRLGPDRQLTVDDLITRGDCSRRLRLVVLSACGTGTAQLAVGDEMLGFIRGFLYNGARNLVLSLWPVDDRATARLMAEFYRKLAAGTDGGPECLRQAMLALARDDRFAHPFYWAPFYAVGV